MKKLIDKSKAPMEKLAESLFHLCKKGKQVTMKDLNSTLSDYRIQYAESDAIYEILPEWLEKGERIKLTREGNDIIGWNFTGEVIEVWERNVAYSYGRIIGVIDQMTNPVRSVGEMIYDESKPAIYHRIVMRDTKEGVIIVPCIKGIKIERLE